MKEPYIKRAQYKAWTGIDAFSFLSASTSCIAEKKDSSHAFLFK
jgi:hypothetical protein